MNQLSSSAWTTANLVDKRIIEEPSLRHAWSLFFVLQQAFQHSETRLMRHYKLR